MPLTEKDILDTLDHSNDGYYCSFVSLGHPYSYLIDSRINVFRDENRWAMAIERLGDNPRVGGIERQIFYYGNCLQNLGSYNDRPVNYSQSIVEETSSGSENESREKVMSDRSSFRASDEELYRSIPADLKKFLVIDEWFHKDFVLMQAPAMPDAHLRAMYEFNKKLTGLNGISFEEFEQSFNRQALMNNSWNAEQWNSNRPSSYETWQLIAKAIVSGNADDYQPALASNSHWKNWAESGSL